MRVSDSVGWLIDRKINTEIVSDFDDGLYIVVGVEVKKIWQGV